eukprot:7382639-Prymnesium_polylepis.1
MANYTLGRNLHPLSSIHTTRTFALWDVDESIFVLVVVKPYSSTEGYSCKAVSSRRMFFRCIALRADRTAPKWRFDARGRSCSRPGSAPIRHTSAMPGASVIALSPRRRTRPDTMISPRRQPL